MRNRFYLSLFLLGMLGILGGMIYAIPDDARVLVWAVDGPGFPGEQGASNPGQIALMDGAGNLTPVLDVPAQTSVVEACGERATSPNGQYYSFYIGRDQGDVWLMDGQNAPVSLREGATDPLLRSVCLGAGTFRYSPDSSNVGYIAFEPGSGTADFAAGVLKVYDIASGDFIFTRESVTAFDISNGQAAFLNFFTNDQGEADEIAVQLWDEARNADAEIATLEPDQPSSEEDRTRCKFDSGSVHFLPNDQLSVLVGQSCFGGATPRTTWIMYIVDYAGGVNRVQEGVVIDGITGGYQPFARTNIQYITPDQSGLIFSVPDAITGNTAALWYAPLNDPANPIPLLDRQVVMPGNTRPDNATPRLSLDGRWLAVVQTTPAPQNNTLKIFDLADLSLAPISYSAGSPGDVIQTMAFTADSSRLYLVVGGQNSTENRLTAINLADGSNANIERGRYNNGLVVSPDGDEIVIGDTIRMEDPAQPNYLNTISIAVDPPFSTIPRCLKGLRSKKGLC